MGLEIYERSDAFIPFRFRFACNIDLVYRHCGRDIAGFCSEAAEETEQGWDAES